MTRRLEKRCQGKKRDRNRHPPSPAKAYPDLLKARWPPRGLRQVLSAGIARQC